MDLGDGDDPVEGSLECEVAAEFVSVLRGKRAFGSDSDTPALDGIGALTTSDPAPSLSPSRATFHYAQPWRLLARVNNALDVHECGSVRGPVNTGCASS